MADGAGSARTVGGARRRGTVVKEIVRLSCWNCITMEVKSHVMRPMSAKHGVLRVTSVLVESTKQWWQDPK